MPAGKPKDKNMIKARLVVLAQMFYTLTDEDHSMTSPQILEYLENHGVPANEKTLRGDIRLLQELGVDIVKIISRPNRYFWGDRQFEMPELKLLIDAVSASRFITKKKSAELSQKISGLASEPQKKALHRQIQATNRVKSGNESIYYMVDTINEAINQRRKIAFQYGDYSPELKPVLRGGGEVYELSPYALLWNEDYYYVVGWSEKHRNVSTFRVDRMVKPEMLEEGAVPQPEGFSIDDYSKPIFDMYEGRSRVAVSLEVRNDLAKYIVDRFGSDLETRIVSDDRFEVTVEVSLSPTFYAWVFQFDGGMRILAPEQAVEAVTEMVRHMTSPKE